MRKCQDQLKCLSRRPSIRPASPREWRKQGRRRTIHWCIRGRLTHCSVTCLSRGNCCTGC